MSSLWGAIERNARKGFEVLGIPWDVDTAGLRQYMSKFGELDDCIVMKVLGIPWDVDTAGLRQYMSKFGELDDCIVMKERSTGRSRGFGYVTFASVDDAKNALEIEHVLGNRTLEVKVATPKEEMRAPAKNTTRIFVARIPHSVTESMFRSYFETYGEITDLYMPKDQGSKGHRGIGFITFDSADSVETLMAESHELGGSSLEEDSRRPIRMSQGGYGAYNAYISATTRYAVLGAPTLYDHPSVFGRGIYESPRGMGKKIFVGRLPQEASADDLRQYFGKFGRIVDAYVPKDPKKTGHRGFGFVTFADDSVADRVARRTHEILGHEVAIDSATPVEDAGGSGGFIDPSVAYGGYGPMRSSSMLYENLTFDDYGYGASGSRRSSRMDWRYRPY
ncbi:hypothetical protein IEQ34_010586 [Dendrobium chrysotoxum]|uniref:RRM domain-containing protein n=1 Tax=Dendrobium chrysotoxum TaxID=161865 RepID=A0AAV7GW31_DENCH|nr:hypothetical protein IEQ34_010586 [Dendrobium chrysotoxum]